MKEPNNKIGFALLKIVTEQFAILEESYAEDIEASINTNIQFAVLAEQKMLGTKVAFKFFQNKVPFLIIEASCHFQIAEEAWDRFREFEQGKLVVPAGFLAHMAMLTVGTTRGILHAKTESTKFNQFVIPTINVASMISHDLKFELTEK